MATEAGGDQNTAPKATRDRSPAYPFISLKAAIDRLIAFEAKFGRHPAPASKVGLAWKMTEKSSQAFQTLAAMKSFGLVEYKGAKDERVASITEDGRNYLRAQQPEVKAAILKKCALLPRALHTHWQSWGADRPIDAICLDQLVLKEEYTQSAAATFLKVYDETVAFAGLANGDKVVGTGGGESADDGDEDVLGGFASRSEGPNVGEFVSWESNGVIQFQARRVLGRSSDGAFVFVEGSPTGLPLKEITVVPAPAGQMPPTSPPANPFAPKVDRPELVDQAAPGMKGDVFTFPERDACAVFQWPDTMTADELQDLEDWLKIKLRGIKRSIQ